jgi:hypothetical protein
MAKDKPNSPLLGYNNNVRHAGKLFHIQTEDSGVEHPHVITHLFTEGTILATKKTSYSQLLEEDDLEDGVRKLMKDQHKSMAVELRDGVHDEIASKILGEPIGGTEANETRAEEEPEKDEPEPKTTSVQEGRPSVEIDDKGVRIIRPSVVKEVTRQANKKPEPKSEPAGRSIFDTPDEEGDFGESLVTDKSLDDVILSYLSDDLDE